MDLSPRYRGCFKKRFLVAGVLLWFSPLIAHAETIAVIVNKANPVARLDRGEIARLYNGTKTDWPDGKRVKLVNREIGSSPREEFYKKILNAPPDRQFYRAGTPVIVQSVIQRSDQAVIQFVSAIDGAIGYVPVSKVGNSVKVVFVIE